MSEEARDEPRGVGGHPLERDRERDVHEEIRFHLEERARELEEGGLDPREARRAALAAFGDPDRVARRAREAGGEMRTAGGRMAGDLVQDLRYALRTLVREPVFACAALATLALSIGATSAIFALTEAALLRSPPVEAPGELVSVYTTCRAGDPRCSSSWPDLQDYRGVASLTDLAGWSWLPVSVASPGEPPLLLTAMLVTGDYFGLLGVPPALGRPLSPGDDRPGAPAAVAVLAWDTWRAAFGGDPGVVGRTVRVNEVAFQVVGVAPEGFRGTALGGDPDLFLPITSGGLLGVGAVAREDIWEDRSSRWIDALVGRRAPGATVDRVQEEMRALAAGLNETWPDARGGRQITVDPAARYALPQFARDDLIRLVGLLAAVVGLSLLLACANVANLLLARASRRRREMGVRLALGSGQGRLVRQVLVESVVLAVLGGVGGLAVARALIAVLSGFELPGGVPLGLLDVRLDGRVLAFALAVSVGTGLLFGLAPALRAARQPPAGSLRASRGGGARESGRLRRTLVAAQVGVCLVLLVGGALFLRALRSGLDYDLGMRPDGLALASFDLSLLRLGPEEAMGRVDAVLERVRRLPGVTSAAVTTRVPLQSGGNMGYFVSVDGYLPSPDEEMRVELALATAGLTGTLAVPVVQGGDLQAAPGDELRVLVNREMAGRYWRGARAVGGMVELGGRSLRVVGVTENVAWRTVPQPPLSYLVGSLHQFPDFATRMPLTLVVRSSGDPRILLPRLREEALAVEPRLTFHFVQTMEDTLGAVLAPQRMGALLLAAFGGLALVLAAVGIGGVVAYVVGRQRREIGIRIALGASRARVQVGVLREVLLPVGVGVAGGLVVAPLLGRAAEAFLVEVRPEDPATYAGAVALLVGVATAAAWLPARGASRVDPAEVLEAE